MNFEQFTEEIRAAYPDAGVISATEQPLAVMVDGVRIDSAPLLSAHTPCWLRVDKQAIRADGMDAATLQVEFPSRANLDMVLVISHGASVLEETLALDAAGKGELELVSSTPGEILIKIKDKPVRRGVLVEEE